MSEQEKKRQRIYDLLNVETKANVILWNIYKANTVFLKIFFTEQELFKEIGEWRIEQKTKDGFLTALATAVKKDPTMSTRKHANELKVHEKTVKRPIK